MRSSIFFSSLCNSTDKFYICLKVDEDFQIQMSAILNAAEGREFVSNNQPRGIYPNFLNNKIYMPLLCIQEYLVMLKMKILKACVTPSPVTCVSLLLNMISVLIIKYIALNFIQKQLCRFQKSVRRLLVTILDSGSLFMCEY